ncbi:MAG: hypothetical protein LBO09_00585 [Candidatus Peribacteria bacterium]|jgi:hypothetical protein|nr:hypothetical protein [Candidatus Peribacteria bacterium]
MAKEQPEKEMKILCLHLCGNLGNFSLRLGNNLRKKKEEYRRGFPVDADMATLTFSSFPQIEKAIKGLKEKFQACIVFGTDKCLKGTGKYKGKEEKLLTLLKALLPDCESHVFCEYSYEGPQDNADRIEWDIIPFLWEALEKWEAKQEMEVAI